VQGQTREHALLAYYFGVRSLVVAVNKMDLVDWSQQRFAEVQERLSKVLKGVGYDVDKVGVCGCAGGGA
jgi:translation elongation factor EF-1alpha